MPDEAPEIAEVVSDSPSEEAEAVEVVIDQPDETTIIEDAPDTTIIVEAPTEEPAVDPEEEIDRWAQLYDRLGNIERRIDGVAELATAAVDIAADTEVAAEEKAEEVVEEVVEEELEPLEEKVDEIAPTSTNRHWLFESASEKRERKANR